MRPVSVGLKRQPEDKQSFHQKRVEETYIMRAYSTNISDNRNYSNNTNRCNDPGARTIRPVIAGLSANSAKH
jgi:hypothetical protein